jgi:hypothetical protein
MARKVLLTYLLTCLLADSTVTTKYTTQNASVETQAIEQKTLAMRVFPLFISRDYLRIIMYGMLYGKHIFR